MLSPFKRLRYETFEEIEDDEALPLFATSEPFLTCLNLGNQSQVPHRATIAESATRARPKKGRKWNATDDRMLICLVQQFGGNWKEIAFRFPGKTQKQVKERWINQLDPQIADIPWTFEDDMLLVFCVRRFGRSWCRITQEMPGRSELMLKNRFHSFIRKKLLPEMLDPKYPFDEIAVVDLLTRAKRKSSILSTTTGDSTNRSTVTVESLI